MAQGTRFRSPDGPDLCVHLARFARGRFARQPFDRDASRQGGGEGPAAELFKKAQLADPGIKDQSRAKFKIPAERIAALEVAIDNFETELKPLRQFILAGGGNGGAHVSNSFDFIWDRAGDSSATTGDSDDTSRVSSESPGGASGDTPPSDFGDRPPGDSGDTQNYGIDSNSEILNDEVSAGSKQSCVSDHRDDTHHHGPSGLDSFERWWQNYPLRVAKDDALREYNKIIVAGRASHDDLLRGAMRYGAVCAGKDPRYFPYPANWLKGGRWSDEPEPQYEQANSDAAVEAILSTAHRTRSAS